MPRPAPRPCSHSEQAEQSADRCDLPGRGERDHRNPVLVGAASPARARVERGREGPGLHEDAPVDRIAISQALVQQSALADRLIGNFTSTPQCLVGHFLR